MNPNEILRLNSFIRHHPTVMQSVFLSLHHVPEVLYGGAAGGGKSDALLMAALQFVDVPDYSALILRRTYSDLSLPGALIDRSREWLSNRARWRESEKTWEFPSGATLTFGYLESASDKYRYQSSEFQYIAFDELTQFTEQDYLFLFSRLRRSSESCVPLRMRAATNPGGRGHDWVKARFIDTRHPDRCFIPARLTDNPYLDHASYLQSLSHLPLVERERLLHGDWDIRPAGNYFRRDWFQIIDDPEVQGRSVRAWDLASTAQSSSRHDPDWCVGMKLVERATGEFVICDLQRFRASPEQTMSRIVQTARLDGSSVQIVIEQESGSSGKLFVSALQRELPNYRIQSVPVRGDKVARAAMASAMSERGQIQLLQGDWIEAFLSELEWFPDGGHDDQVDALSLAVNTLKQGIIQTWAY